MMNSKKKTALLALLSLSIVSSAFARDVVCTIARDAKTVNEIRGLSLHQVRGNGSWGTATIIRDRVTEHSNTADMIDGEFSWGENRSLAPGQNYSLSESVIVRKQRSDKGSSFTLMKIQSALGGPNCDGAHMCDSSSAVIESAPISCVDSDDEIRPPSPPSQGDYNSCESDPHHCY